jgi:tRNA 2-thiouridine synthesizing protein A
MPDAFLDLKGLKCPLPALKARKKLASMNHGDILEVHCTDPMSAIDIPHMVQELGSTVVTQSVEQETWMFRIRLAKISEAEIVK